MLDNQVVKGVTGPSNGGPCKTPEFNQIRFVKSLIFRIL